MACPKLRPVHRALHCSSALVIIFNSPHHPTDLPQMTADRRVERRSNRSQLASPYSQRARPARPAPLKKSVSTVVTMYPWRSLTPKQSSWSLSGIFSFLNPLRSRGSEEPDEREDLNDEPEIHLRAQPSGAQPQALPSTPPQPRNLNTKSTPSPAVSLSPLTFSNSASPSKNVDAVKNYLSENGSRQLNPVEIAGLVSLLQDSIDGSEGELFYNSS